MRNSGLVKYLALFLALMGIGLIVFVTAPIISYELYSRSKYPDLISPVSDDGFGKESLSALKTDYTKASNWFADEKKKDDFTSEKITYYNLSIPKLGIINATVSLGGEDLSDNLIQYPGTALPGKIGNAVVFGHSVLPQFFDPENYLTIFSTLPRLDRGDEIIVNYDGVTYRYRVETMFEVKPTDIQILEQNAGDSYFTLVTCTPPGHPLKPRRLIVRAKIVPAETSL